MVGAATPGPAPVFVWLCPHVGVQVQGAGGGWRDLLGGFIQQRASGDMRVLSPKSSKQATLDEFSIHMHIRGGGCFCFYQYQREEGYLGASGMMAEGCWQRASR